MEFNITQEEILEEVKRMKEEERFKEIASSEIKNGLVELSSRMKVMCQEEKTEREDSIKEMKTVLEQVLGQNKEKDQEISSLKNSIKLENGKMVQKDKEIKELSSLVMTSRAILDSLHSEIMSMKSELLLSKHKDSEDLDMLKINIKRYIKSFYYGKVIKLTASYGYNCQHANYKINSNFVQMYSEYRDEYPEIKSSLSKYILQKVHKYLEGNSLVYKSGPSTCSPLPNSKDLYICKLFDEVISKDEKLGNIVIPILTKYKDFIPKSLDRDNIELKHKDLAPQIAKELLMSLP